MVLNLDSVSKISQRTEHLQFLEAIMVATKKPRVPIFLKIGKITKPPIQVF
jgi:hypothetical protein